MAVAATAAAVAAAVAAPAASSLVGTGDAARMASPAGSAGTVLPSAQGTNWPAARGGRVDPALGSLVVLVDISVNGGQHRRCRGRHTPDIVLALVRRPWQAHA
jgi:hypothetical protein